jgi:hypothetical protein
MQEQKNIMNVAEAWPIYDTICVCNTFYGNESAELGWYQSFATFAEKQTHSFFKSRTLGQIGQQYCNKQTLDTMDFAFEAYSMGLAFYAPGVRLLGKLTGGALLDRDVGSAHWWEVEFPRHCSIQFKVQQDIVAELPAMMANPGYGPQGSGASMEHEDVVADVPNGATNPAYPPVMNWGLTQGVPSISARWRFPKKIKIPRTATIEGILEVSDLARGVLEGLGDVDGAGAPGGPLNYIFADAVEDGDVTYSEFPARFGIQMSLIGKRLVQQRAQYHS